MPRPGQARVRRVVRCASGRPRRERGVRLETLNEGAAKTAVRGESPTRWLSRALVSDTSAAYAFVAPAFFLLLFLVAYPFVLSLWFSLSDARVGETGSLVGLDNFARLLRSGLFLQTLQNSIGFTAAALTLKTVLGRIRALLLVRLGRFNRLLRG